MEICNTDRLYVMCLCVEGKSISHLALQTLAILLNDLTNLGIIYLERFRVDHSCVIPTELLTSYLQFIKEIVTEPFRVTSP